jgi:hypothetical protein
MCVSRGKRPSVSHRERPGTSRKGVNGPLGECYTRDTVKEANPFLRYRRNHRCPSRSSRPQEGEYETALLDKELGQIGLSLCECVDRLIDDEAMCTYQLHEDEPQVSPATSPININPDTGQNDAESWTRA